MNQITHKQATAFVNEATGKNFKSFDDIQKYIAADTPVGATPSEQNEKLININNKLIQMITVKTFETSAFGFRNTMTYGDGTIPVGAQMQILGLPLLDVKDDKISSATDLLPDIANGIPKQFVKTYLTNYKKRIELLVNGEIFLRAFTSIAAFNAFMNEYEEQITNSMTKFFFEEGLTILKTGIKNVKPLAGTASDLGLFLTGAYKDWASTNPYSTEFNLGSADNKVIPVGANNAEGLDQQMNVKTNVTRFVKDENGKMKYVDSILFIKAKDYATYNVDFVADKYHDDYLALEKLYGDVVIVPDTFTWGGATEPAFGCWILDRKAYIRKTNIKAFNTQFWAKGEGGGLFQMVSKNWSTLGVNPFANGRAYTSAATPASDTPIVVDVDTEDEAEAKAKAKRKAAAAKAAATRAAKKAAAEPK